MLLNYHDGMAICRQYGAPDLFITFTCNPRWQEIVDALASEPGQTAADRPDITTRVFSMKFEEFLDGVKNGTPSISLYKATIKNTFCINTRPPTVIEAKINDVSSY